MIINIRDDDFQDLCVCAFRYGLGRRTYITSALSNLLIRHSDKLNKYTRILIVKEIKEAIYKSNAGMEMDEQCWIELLNCLIGYPNED